MWPKIVSTNCLKTGNFTTSARRVHKNHPNPSRSIQIYQNPFKSIQTHLNPSKSDEIHCPGPPGAGPGPGGPGQWISMDFDGFWMDLDGIGLN